MRSAKPNAPGRDALKPSDLRFTAIRGSLRPMPSDERRKFPRRAVSVVVSSKFDGSDAERDVAVDISQGGLFLKTAKRPTLGETLHVEITPPKSQKVFRATATVARVTP